MDLAASVPLSMVPESSGAMAAMPAFNLSIGSCMPITPVDATKTALSGTFSAAEAAWAVSAQ